MPLRQTIGISLALLVISAGAFAKLPEKSGSHHPGQNPAAKAHRCAEHVTSGHVRSRNHARSRASARHTVRYSHHHAVYRPTAVGLDVADRDAAAARSAGPIQIGAAAWYGLVGHSTSNGERLDTVTPTAAHRSLPLASYAKVTSLDSGRSVIVRINDRGPYNRRFIIDLSPRAADLLGMRQAGVAAVAVEPVAGPAGNPIPTTAVYRTAGVVTMQ